MGRAACSPLVMQRTHRNGPTSGHGPTKACSGSPAWCVPRSSMICAFLTSSSAPASCPRPRRTAPVASVSSAHDQYPGGGLVSWRLGAVLQFGPALSIQRCPLVATRYSSTAVRRGLGAPPRRAGPVIQSPRYLDAFRTRSGAGVQCFTADTGGSSNSIAASFI